MVALRGLGFVALELVVCPRDVAGGRLFVTWGYGGGRWQIALPSDSGLRLWVLDRGPWLRALASGAGFGRWLRARAPASGFGIWVAGGGGSCLVLGCGPLVYAFTASRRSVPVAVPVPRVGRVAASLLYL